MNKSELYKLPKDLLIEIILKTHQMSPLEMLKERIRLTEELNKSFPNNGNYFISLGLCISEYILSKDSEKKKMAREKLQSYGLNEKILDSYTTITVNDALNKDNFNYEKHNKEWIKVKLIEEYIGEIVMYPDAFPIGFACKYVNNSFMPRLFYVLPDKIVKIY